MPWPERLRPTRRRVTVALAAGLLAVPVVAGVRAAWTDSVPVGGTNLTAGRIDLLLDNADSVTATQLTMTAMVPGSSSAQVLAVRNGGTVPLRWTMSGQLAGADAAAYAGASALRLTVVHGGTRSGSGSTATCTGGTRTETAVAGTTAQLVSGAGVVLAVGGSGTVCVQVALAADAPTTLQGKTASLALVATGTTDVGP